MKTIKYTVDHRFRKAGEVRQEEDAVAENLIHRGFAEETGETPDDTTGDGSAVDQYHPQGADADLDSRGGAQPLPAELNAPGVSGSNVRSAKGKAAKSALESKPSAAALTSEVSTGNRTGAKAAEEASASETTEDGEHTDAEKQGGEQEQGGEQQS